METLFYPIIFQCDYLTDHYKQVETHTLYV